MNAKGFSPFVGMDALRAFNKINKSLFDVHTKRYSGFTDEYGIQYAGTVENFGSELLLEPRKLLMDKLPIGDIFTKNTMSFYFDIDYSGYVNTYDQQNMLCATLKKDALLSNKEYKVYFENVEKVYIPRSRSSSAPDVYRDAFYVTTTPPKMIIYNEDETSSEVDLILTDNTNNDSKYYFHVGVDTNDIVDSIDEENHTILTKALSYKMIGFSFIWITCDALRTLPNIGFINNEYYNDLPLLTIGNNGHDGGSDSIVYHYGGDSIVYPFMNGLPSINNSAAEKWFIKVNSADNTAFTTRSSDVINYSSEIKEIHFIMYHDEQDLPNTTPSVDICITYDHTYSKMMLFTEDLFNSVWSFRRPEEGDYDYDGRTYRNLPYAYSKLMNFYNNWSYSTNTKLIPGFSIAFDEKYHFLNEDYLLNTFTGIHVDNNGDLSDNGISKKYGTIHDLGDFDGLPPYFKYYIKENLHRSHMEMYSIRDKQDDPNQDILDKQVAGIIIDSAIPKMTTLEVPEGANPTVVYAYTTDEFMRYEDRSGHDHYVPINDKNHLTEITYHDDNTCGNSTMNEYKDEPKFIYHGNGIFTLDLFDELSPIDEYGRVYIISNDPITYENSLITGNKPARTFARICDIPTNYMQLTGIRGYIPTFVVDSKYVHTECNFIFDDKNIIYNRIGRDNWLGSRLLNVYYAPVVFPESSFTVMEALFKTMYPFYSNLNGQITLDFDNIISLTFDISDVDYTDGTHVRIYFGGFPVEFELHNNGVEIAYDVITDIPSGTTVNRSFFEDRISTLTVFPLTGNDPIGDVTVTIDEISWASSEMRKTNDSLNSGFYFMFDHDGYVWVIDKEYDSTIDRYRFVFQQRLTGEELYENKYDAFMDNDSDKVSDAFMYNTINPVGNTLGTVSNVKTTDIPTVITNDNDVTGNIDYSYQLNESLINSQDTFYIIHPETETNHTVVSIERYHVDEALYYLITSDVRPSDWPTTDEPSTKYFKKVNSTYVGVTSTDSYAKDRYYVRSIYGFAPLQHPTMCDLSLSSYTNKPNRFRMTDTDNAQPSLVVYDPAIDHKLSYDNDVKINNVKVIESKNKITCSDVLTNEFHTGNIANCNIYRYNEFDTTKTIDGVAGLRNYSRETLLEMLQEKFPECDILKNPDDYSKTYIVNYFMQNLIDYNIDGSFYTDNPSDTVYRRNNISLFAVKDEDLTNKDFKGDIINITDERYYETIEIDGSPSKAYPLYVFKLDIDSFPVEGLNGFRVYDEAGNDISEYCIIIINMNKYVAEINGDNITWVYL